MVELRQSVSKTVFSPPLVPVERPIDFEHLSRMTLGDRTLEREVLSLFVRQAEMLRARMRNRPCRRHRCRGSYAQRLGDRYRRMADCARCG